MNASRKFAAVLLASVVSVAAAVYSVRAQPQGQIPQPAQAPAAAAPAMNHNLVLLDPAHGGTETGSTLGDRVLEKEVTLAMAAKLRAALTAAGFTVIATRDADAGDPLTTDQRAEIANRTHALACIVLHATATGSGVHVYTSTLQSSDAPDASYPSGYVPIPWELAQAGFSDQSQRLASGLNDALRTASLPAVVGRAAVLPLDNLMCPAVAVELAPLVTAGSDTIPVGDADYQQRVVGSLTAALKSWRDENTPAPKGTP